MPDDIKQSHVWIKSVLIVIVIAFIVAAASGFIYADWWAFNQKFPHASFWAWVIS